jgi:hypothetical protein
VGLTSQPPIGSPNEPEWDKNRRLPRQDELFPLSFDMRRQVFVENQHRRTFSDFDDPLLRGDEPPSRQVRPVRDILDLLSDCVSLHQMEWRASPRNEYLLYFPFMFITPQIGWQLRNTETRDVYVVKHVGTDTQQEFTGAVLFEEGLRAPGQGSGAEPGRWDRLEWVSPNGKVIKFHVSWPEKEAVEASGPVGDQDESTTGPVGMSPVITSLLVRQEPGTIGKREFDPAKMGKPQILGYSPDPFDPKSYSLELQWQWFENIIQFDCWSPLHAEAERLADWFQTFMNLYTWVLKRNGISEVRFWHRRADLITQSFRDGVPRRSLQYYVRINMVNPIRVRNVTQFKVTGSLFHEPGPIPSTAETGGGPWVSQWDQFHDESGNWLGGTMDWADTRSFADSFSDT